MKEIVLTSPIIKDEYTEMVEKMFDVAISAKSEVSIKNNIQLPEKWNIGLIYGPSGSGKSTILKEFGAPKEHYWDNTISTISNFKKVSPTLATEALCSVGFSTIPAWIRPYSVLSNGEKFRADLARSLVEDDIITIIDEFTSVVDRNVAKSASNSVQKFIRKYDKKILLASCHSDIIEWLQPDWVYNPTEGITHILPRGSLHRPQISLKIFRSKYEAWDLFKHHHYLSGDLNKSAKCYLATWNDVPVAFSAILSFPHAIVKKGWRESRTVVLPDYQGLGIGVKMSDYMASVFKGNGCRFFSKTAHPAMISYRLKHKDLWIETRHSRKNRTSKDSGANSKGWGATERLCHAFEYIGPTPSIEECKLFL